MALNSSSSSSDPLLHLNLPVVIDCFTARSSSLVFTIFFITNILLLLPLCSFILYLGLQRWRQQRSTSAASTMSHTDSFTYHMVTMELIDVFGCTLCCCGIFWDGASLLFVGYYLMSFNWYGETFFHILTCLERYLAVVHPVTYLSLRRERGIRIRNISIGCVWLLCLGTMILLVVEYISLFVGTGFFIFSLFVVTVCNLSVLFVLIRPGPGEQGGDRLRVDQSKRRAFYTITAILGVLLFRSSGSLVWTAIRMMGGRNLCTITAAEIWLNLPASLVLPLLFVQRAGILACCKNTE